MLSNYYILCNKKEENELKKRKKLCIQVKSVSVKNLYIISLKFIFIYIVYKYNFKKYKLLEYKPFKYNIRTRYDILMQITYMCIILK